MKEYLNKNISIIISIFLLLNPIIDILTGITIHYHTFPITIGIIYRILFMLFIIIEVVFIFKKKEVLPYYIVILVYSIFYLLGINANNLFRELQGLIKVFYFPIILISLYNIKDEIRISKLVLFTVLFTYLITIFVPLLLGIGYKSYEITKAGTLGFYNSANEISGLISILTPILLLVILNSKNLISKILLLVMYLVVILMMGTKTPILVFFITSFLLGIYYYFNWFKKKEYKKIVLSSSIVLVITTILIIIIPTTNFYKNIKTHLKFLKVDNVYEVFEKEELIDHFIFSQRLTFLKNKSKIYHKANSYQKAFGIGYYNNSKEIKAIEIDYLDILYSHGYIGFIIFFSIFILVLYKILLNRKRKSLESFLSYISLMWILILSFFTGHIITSPAVSTICAIIIISINKNNKKYLLIVYNNLKEAKAFTKNLDSNYLIKYQNNNLNTKISLLWFKIINYQIYDLSITLINEDNSIELVTIASLNNALYIKDTNLKDANTKWLITDKVKSRKDNIISIKELNKNI